MNRQRSAGLRRRHLLATLAGALAAPVCAPAWAQTRTVRIGFQKGGLLLLLKLRGVLEPALAAQGWAVRWVEFPAGPALMEGLNVDAIDLGVTGAPPPIFAQAAGIDFVYMGAEPGQPHSEAVIVPVASPARSLADLRGKRVALAKGSSSHYLLATTLQQAGLRYTDVTPVFLGPAEARAAFERGAVDAWVVWDPYLSLAQQATGARALVDYSAVGPPWSFYLARRAFAQAQPALLSAVLREIALFGAWANSHRAEVVAQLAPLFGLPPATMEAVQARVRYGAVPMSAAIAADQQKVADLLAQLKLVPRPVDVAQALWVAPR